MGCLIIIEQKIQKRDYLTGTIVSIIFWRKHDKRPEREEARTMDASLLESFKGACCDLSFRDGSRVSNITCDVIAVDDDFIKVRTFRNEFLIQISQILKIGRSINNQQGQNHEQ